LEDAAGALLAVVLLPLLDEAAVPVPDAAAGVEPCPDAVEARFDTVVEFDTAGV
jgi:hypothetical protein